MCLKAAMQTILLSIPPIRSSANGIEPTKQNFKTENVFILSFRDGYLC